MPNEDTRAALKAILLEKSVRTGEFTLASGKTSDLYIDCRVTAMDPVGANLIGKLGWETVKQEIADRGLDVQAIGGMTLGADPISLAVGMTSASEDKPLQVFTVRKEPKGHGKGKQIEGNFSEGDTIVIVDDVITTGGSTIKAMDVMLAAAGGAAHFDMDDGYAVGPPEVVFDCINRFAAAVQELGLELQVSKSR